MELGQCVLRCGVEPPAHQLPVDLQPGLWEPFLIPATLRSLKSESSAPSCIEAALIYPCDNRGQAQKGLYGLNAAFGADSSWECPWSSLRARWERGTRLQAESRDFRKQYPSWTLHETDNKQPAQIPPGNAQIPCGNAQIPRGNAQIPPGKAEPCTAGSGGGSCSTGKKLGDAAAAPFGAGTGFLITPKMPLHKFIIFWASRNRTASTDP